MKGCKNKMKLGVMTPALYSMDLESALKYLSNLGVQAVEIGTGGYPGNVHLNPHEYLNNPSKVTELKNLLLKYSMEISAFSVHGNPVHPNENEAERFHNDFITTLKIAKIFGIKTIITFSGCPGDCKTSEKPNWVTYYWPPDFEKIIEYQWNDVLIPYWQKAAREAEKYGVTKIALEMHPGFCVYNPETLMKLRNAAGDIIGVNFDPSHLFWQGINPALAIEYLGSAIYHFHAKDTLIDKDKCAINGVLSTASKSFRTVGYGHDKAVWKEIISALKAVGYDGAISIEHEDMEFTPKEGLEKAIEFLKGLLIDV
jgi:sugar phosphate isomerase/epimerase